MRFYLIYDFEDFDNRCSCGQDRESDHDADLALHLGLKSSLEGSI